MTNFLPRFALKSFLFAATSAAFVGCGVDCDKEYAKGCKAYEERNFKLAVSCLNNVVKERPHDVDALVMLARAEFSLANFVKAFEALKAASVTNSSDSDIIELLGKVAFYSRDYAAAEKYFSKLALDTSRPASIRAIGFSSLGVIDFMKIGSKLETSSYRDSARVKFLKAIELDYRNSPARYNLARLYRDSFNYLDIAKEQFEYFAHLEKDDVARVREVRESDIPSLKEDIAKRKSSLPGVSRRDPVACAEFLKKADVFFAKKEYDNAKKMYAKALDKDSSSYPAAIGLARSINIPGASKAALSDALEAYKRAYTIRPLSTESFVSAGDIAAHIGRAAFAVELYSRALALNPSNKSVLAKHISCLERTGSKSIAKIYSDYLSFLKSK